MFTSVQEYLGQFAGREVCFLPNPGNAGDSLMASATYQMLDRVGARYRVPHIKGFDAAKQFVLYGGGGNLSGRARYSYKVLQRIHRTAKHLTILPHTIRDVDDLLSEFGSNVTIIARERVTYEYISGFRRRYETLLLDDLAFGLDLDELMNGGEPFNAPAMLAGYVLSRALRRSGHTVFGNVRRYLNPGPVADELAARPAGGVLNCFRLDNERTEIEIPANNVDLPIIYMFGVAPAPVAHHAARCLIETLRKFDEVRTNRLHIAIAAALIGKPTQFHPNNYFKCQAVWEHSMRHRFPHVTWMGPMPSDPAPDGAE
jgi:exopolysaccharide biosynthesis predicted pyruvyltransferase EpsI